MIFITPDIRKRYHAAFKKARNEKIKARRLEPDLWYAARVAEGHGRYFVRFHVIQQINGGEQIGVTCNSINGERCKGTIRRQNHLQDPMCVHIATAIDRGIQYGQRKQKIEGDKRAA